MVQCRGKRCRGLQTRQQIVCRTMKSKPASWPDSKNVGLISANFDRCYAVRWVEPAISRNLTRASADCQQTPPPCIKMAAGMIQDSAALAAFEGATPHCERPPLTSGRVLATLERLR